MKKASICRGQVYASWISGYSYDDTGNLKTDENGEWTETDEPHWIDHIPVGEYVLEETECPYEQGYVQKKRENIQILETENVQSFTMEDDFTSVEIRKEDGKTGELLYEDSLAKLTLYQVPEKEKDKALESLMKEKINSLRLTGPVLWNGRKSGLPEERKQMLPV